MQVTIRKNEILVLTTQPEISCREGVLWITEPGDQRDYILNAGETFRPSGGTPVILEARRDAVA
ncbi:MAG TPA: DUF2917 domain-containing protein, partial [Verrucomicrobiae bacterium]|nr:DUF2917 domain-containing protein [Verrucomicrobiae bacterium]